MRTVFADTFYFFALLNVSDEAHAAAVKFTREFPGRYLTTDWVLTEVADGLSASPRRREKFPALRRKLIANPQTQIIPFDELIFEQAIKLYSERPDKQWSLTDCTSFVVMQREQIGEALSGDRHFKQAGFTLLFSASS